MAFKQATPAEIKRRRDAAERLRIIDVRERDEYRVAHMAEAQLMPMSEIRSRWQDLPRDEELVIMCHHGIRSAQVCAALTQAGFNRLTNMDGGIDAWAACVDPSVPRY